MTMTAQEYRANARQCLFWAESARDPENREAFFALAATWERAAARIERSNAVPEIRATREPSLRRAAAG
jgi:ferric-dicitrate binding protein FerR (iron transport regulator)